MSKFSNYFAGFLSVAGVALIIACFCGWVLNLIKLAGLDVIGVEFVMRAIGIFVAPLGVVMGYL